MQVTKSPVIRCMSMLQRLATAQAHNRCEGSVSPSRTWYFSYRNVMDAVSLSTEDGILFAVVPTSGTDDTVILLTPYQNDLQQQPVQTAMFRSVAWSLANMVH